MLAAFELLWAEGLDVNHAIVCKAGWMVQDFADAVRRHPQMNRPPLWRARVSGVYLERIYTAFSSLTRRGELEGFGLLLIERARKHLPVIAGETSVFPEVTGRHAFYFSGESADELAAAIGPCLGQWRERSHAAPEPRLPQLLANIC